MKKLIEIKNKNIGVGKQKGFTLVEMMVAVGLFAIVMLVTTSVILSVINGNRKVQSINSVVNNLNFSIESMVRDIKTGYWYMCVDYYSDGNSFTDLASFKDDYYLRQLTTGSPYSCKNVPQPIKHIAFISTLSGQPKIVQYTFTPGSGTTTPGKISKISYDDSVGSAVSSPITTPDINVKKVDFYINNPPPKTGVSKSLAAQPDVFLVIKGNTKTGSRDTDVSAFNLQTYISQRLLNI